MAFKISNLFNGFRSRGVSSLSSGEESTTASTSTSPDSTSTDGTETTIPEGSATHPNPEGSLTTDGTSHGSTPGTRGTDVRNPIISD